MVKKSLVSPPSNPNRVDKHLAPWFTEECRHARRHFRSTARAKGRTSVEAAQAFQDYRATCRAASLTFAASLPDMLKYRPREFWHWVNYAPR